MNAPQENGLVDCYTAMAFVVDDNDDKIFEMFSICLSPNEL